MIIEVDKSYETRCGQRVYIMGPASSPDHPTALWSLGGDHYLPDGRLIGCRRSTDGRELEVFVYPKAWPDTLVAEIPTHEFHVGLAAEWQAKQDEWTRQRLRPGRRGR